MSLIKAIRASYQTRSSLARLLAPEVIWLLLRAALRHNTAA